MGERGKYQRYSRSFEGARTSFFPVPALPNMVDRVRGGVLADPDRATPWPCLSEWLRPILPDRRCGVSGRQAMTLRGADGETTIHLLL